ncbi:MAG: glycosyltransferase family 39 protein [Magnetospirillum sp.]|nr:glycosyltransferase family 39 protein [Magnetospirillum sp.]
MTSPIPSSPAMGDEASQAAYIPADVPLTVAIAGARWTVWDGAVRLILFAAFVLVVLTFPDFGITHDEEVQAIYGEKLLSWYLSGFADRSAFNYLDLFWYGGLFDLVAAILNKVSPFGYYETRHLLGGLVGVGGLFLAWRLGRLAGGPRAGMLATVLLAMTPAYIGHSFNNPKDVPFAVGMLWALYALARVVIELPRPRTRTVAWFGVALGVALSIRVGALLIIGYLGLAVLAHFGLRLRMAGWDRTRRQVGALTPRMLGALALAWAVIALFWPWAVQDPLNPVRALSHFSRYDIDIESMFAGRLVPATNLPALYLPGYLAVTLPEAVLVGFAALAGGLALRRRRPDEDGRVVALTLLAALFPIAFFIVFRPTAYDGLRHFLFVIPPIAVLSALGLERLWAWAESRSRKAGRAFAALLLGAAVIQGTLIARLHPDEYIYYNALVGGVRGAASGWELDYWSNSMHEATDRLADAVLLENGGKPPARPVKVDICGNGLSASYFFPRWMVETQSLADADYIICFTQADCWQTWRGRPVAEITRFGALLSVVKDRRGLPDPGRE